MPIDWAPGDLEHQHSMLAGAEVRSSHLRVVCVYSSNTFVVCISKRWCFRFIDGLFVFWSSGGWVNVVGIVSCVVFDLLSYFEVYLQLLTPMFVFFCFFFFSGPFRCPAIQTPSVAARKFVCSHLPVCDWVRAWCVCFRFCFCLAFRAFL